MELTEILPQLIDWFPAEDHKERQIKGGSRWYYISHTTIRDRLNKICPGQWSTEYDGPHLIDGEPIYHCRLTVCGTTRTGIGDKSNEPSNYGTAAQRSFRKAFVDAAEQFGIGAYLDEQTSEKTKRNFARYMHGNGDGRAALNYHRNEGNLSTTAQPSRKADVSQPFGQPDRPSKPAATTRPTVRPTAAPNQSANLTRLRSIVKQLGYSESDGDRQIQEAIALNCPGKKSADLDTVQVNRVIDSLLIFWAEQQGAGSVEKLDGLYAREISGNEARASLNDADLIRAWQAIAFPNSVRA